MGFERLTKKRRGVLPKMLITNSFPLAQVKELIASEYPWFRELAGPEWRFLELLTVTGPCSPGPMISLSCSSISFHRRHPIHE